MSGGILDAVPPMPEGDLVQVAFENLLLGVVSLHLERGRLLAELSCRTGISAIDDRRMHIADKLLRDGARSAPGAEYIVLERAGYADIVDAFVLVEAVVFDGDERLGQIARERADRNALTKLFSDLTDERAVACENEG